MMRTTSAWQRKLLAVTLFAVVVWFVFTSVIHPVADRFDQHRNALSNAEHQLAQYTRIANGAEALSSRLSELSTSEFDRYFYRRATSATVAAAGIQNDLRGWITKHGGQVVSAQAKSAVGQGDKYKIPVAITFTGNILTLQKILYDIEKNVPYLIIDRMTVKHQHGGNKGAGEPQNQLLSVKLEVSGHGKKAGANG